MTRRRVAVVSSCAPPLDGHPVTGGGLRTAQLVATLRADKHSVTTLIEAGALPADAPDGLIPFEHATLTDQLRAAKPQVIVLEQWALAAALGDPAADGAPDVPLVIDLHGSLLLENVYRRGTLDVVLDGKTKLDALRRADLLLVPAAAQLHHFASWATLAGFDPRELPLALLPLATPAAVPTPRTDPKPPLRLVYGGARWPWIDSLDALRVAAEVVRDTAHARLDVFTYEPPRHGLPFEEDLGTWPEVDDVLRGPGRKVTAHGRTPHDAWLAFIQEDATVALDLWTPNPERMLASTTRTIEFLAAGLPVITRSGACWAEELVATGAGWTVDSDDDLRVLLADLSAHPKRVAAASWEATELARRRADHAATGAALLEFVQSPHRPPRSPATLVDAIVAVRQAHLDETLRSHDAAHADEHARLVAAHRAQTEALRERHAAEVAELRAGRQAELAEVRAERKAEVAQLAVEHREELRRRDAAAKAEADRVRAANDARFEAQAEAHRQELVAQHAALAARDQELREAVEARDTWHGRWKADRATEKEERVRRQVESQAAMTAREAALRAESERQLSALRTQLEAEREAVRAELQARIDAFEARRVVRLADSVSGAFAGPKRAPGGRITPATRLAKLWVEHALDREHD